MGKARVTLHRQPIHHVVIVYRRMTKDAYTLSVELATWLKERKIQVYSHPQQILPNTKKLKITNKIDLVVVLGGDGTYLEAVRMLGPKRVPILGVNMGGLGFLTLVRAPELIPMVELALNGKLEIKKRSMIRAQVKNNGRVKHEFSVLNDMVIERGGLSRLIDVTLSVDGLPITSIKADGLIVATPTGSTAYNLAAGGPILHPEVEALVVTPICPHSLTSRPFIFPDLRKIRLSISGARASLTGDGLKRANLSGDDEVWLCRDEDSHLSLRKPGFNYFNLLKEKLKFGERA